MQIGHVWMASPCVGSGYGHAFRPSEPGSRDASFFSGFCDAVSRGAPARSHVRFFYCSVQDLLAHPCNQTIGRGSMAERSQATKQRPLACVESIQRWPGYLMRARLGGAAIQNRPQIVVIGFLVGQLGRWDAKCTIEVGCLALLHKSHHSRLGNPITTGFGNRLVLVAVLLRSTQPVPNRL